MGGREVVVRRDVSAREAFCVDLGADGIVAHVTSSTVRFHRNGNQIGVAEIDQEAKEANDALLAALGGAAASWAPPAPRESTRPIYVDLGVDQLRVRVTASTVELYQNGRRIGDFEIGARS